MVAFLVRQMKKELRAEMIRRRDNIETSVRQRYSRQIKQWVIESPEYQNAKRVFCFLSMGAEVDTRPLVQQALAEGKQVAVPVAKGKRLMYFLEISSLYGLKYNTMGIGEPEGSIEQAVLPEKNDLFLTPCVAFDENFTRLGYGGGYYDTFFEKQLPIQKIALAFDEQKTDMLLPMEEHDHRVDAVITQSGWRRRRMH